MNEFTVLATVLVAALVLIGWRLRVLSARLTRLDDTVWGYVVDLEHPSRNAVARCRCGTRLHGVDPFDLAERSMQHALRCRRARKADREGKAK